MCVALKRLKREQQGEEYMIGMSFLLKTCSCLLFLPRTGASRYSERVGELESLYIYIWLIKEERY